MAVAAQVSLYPLRQAHLSPAIDRALAIFQASGLDVVPGSMSSLITGDEGRVFNSLRKAFEDAARDGEVVMVVTLSNSCPVPARSRSGRP